MQMSSMDALRNWNHGWMVAVCGKGIQAKSDEETPVNVMTIILRINDWKESQGRK